VDVAMIGKEERKIVKCTMRHTRGTVPGRAQLWLATNCSKMDKASFARAIPFQLSRSVQQI